MARNVKELLKQTRQRRKAQITLSTGEAFDLYFLPLTEAEDEKIREAVADDRRPNAYGLRVLVNKAEYEDGEKMFALSDIPSLRNEYAKHDLNSMMEALVFNTGVLAKEDPKSNKGGDQE